jgi:hypothetical protein
VTVPNTWVKPRKSKLVPSVSGSRSLSVVKGRKSTMRALSAWSVSPKRARRLPTTARTRWVSTRVSNTITAKAMAGADCGDDPITSQLLHGNNAHAGYRHFRE